MDAGLTEDSYFESSYWLNEDKLVFEFIDSFGSTKEDFYAEVLERYTEFPVTYKALYQGPDFKIDEKTLGQAIEPR